MRDYCLKHAARLSMAIGLALASHSSAEQSDLKLDGCWSLYAVVNDNAPVSLTRVTRDKVVVTFENGVCSIRENGLEKKCTTYSVGQSDESAETIRLRSDTEIASLAGHTSSHALPDFSPGEWDDDDPLGPLDDLPQESPAHDLPFVIERGRLFILQSNAHRLVSSDLVPLDDANRNVLIFRRECPCVLGKWRLVKRTMDNGDVSLNDAMIQSQLCVEIQPSRIIFQTDKGIMGHSIVLGKDSGEWSVVHVAYAAGPSISYRLQGDKLLLKLDQVLKTGESDKHIVSHFEKTGA